MKKIRIVALFTLMLCFVSCGHGAVNDTDGLIGNEDAEKIKDDVDEIVDDIKNAIDDVMSNGPIDDAITVSARINTEQAKLAATNDAGVNVKDAVFSESYLHNDKGREYYGVSFSVGDAEYRYEIDPYTAAIIKREEAVIR